MLERALRLDWGDTVSLRRGLIFGDLQILERVVRLTASMKPLILTIKALGIISQRFSVYSTTVYPE